MSALILTMQLEVPFYSQMIDVVDLSWQRRACSIVNLKMVLAVLTPDTTPSIEDLIAEGIAIGAYDETIGWSHEGIVRLARNHGVVAYAQEFRSVIIDPETGEKCENNALVEQGLKKCARVLAAGTPVIVSVLPGFGANKSNHTITLIGVDGNGFYCNDPQEIDAARGKARFISNEDFKKQWRRFAIFFDKIEK